MNTDTVLIVGECSLITQSTIKYLKTMGHDNVIIVTSTEIKERGLTIKNTVEPMMLKECKIDEYFYPSPRKDKNKGFTEQPWRKNRKK